MKDDYLWDKSGDPDPEIQELEEILGTLRYQPQPLELPQDLRVPRRGKYLSWIAIAATVVMALLAGIIWLGARTNRAPEQQQQVQGPVVPAPRKEEAIVQARPKEELTTDKPSEQHVTINHKPRNRSSLSAAEKREREEALEAKEQVMLALRLASEKLNMAHRKTQSTPPASQIRNQHRIG